MINCKRVYANRASLKGAVVLADKTDGAMQRVHLGSIPKERISVSTGHSRPLEESITRLVLWGLTVGRIDFLDPGGSCAIDGYIQHCFLNFASNYSATEHEIDYPGL
jgi:hypothetical protein